MIGNRLCDRRSTQRIQQIARRSREAVKARHHENVAGAELVDHTAGLRPVGLGPLATSRNTLPVPCFLKAAT